MDTASLSRRFSVRPLQESDIEAIFHLCEKNTLYYQYCPPYVSRDTIRRDMQALPPGKEMRDKHYLGFFSGSRLTAVLDLIDGYPDPETAFFGFFMVDVSFQHQGIGSAVITELCESLKEQGFREIRLCRAKGNPQPEAFWRKNGFRETGVLYDTGTCTVIVLQKRLI